MALKIYTYRFISCKVIPCVCVCGVLTLCKLIYGIENCGKTGTKKNANRNETSSVYGSSSQLSTNKQLSEDH